MNGRKTAMKKSKILKIMREKLRQGSGKIRRLVAKFRRQHVNGQLKKRKGECVRCGTCCRLLFKCPFLQKNDAQTNCRVHANKPSNCQLFPLCEKDLRDRDSHNPHAKCGYYFE